jgi:ferrochelatase
MEELKAKRAILLINLGTPDSPEPKSVGRYLREFLMDKWVVDIPWLWRWILVNILIVPRRKYKSAEAYKKIWLATGSPLMVYTMGLAQKLREQISPDVRVEVAMRYGSPSIAEVLKKLSEDGFKEIDVLPLYPQYAESSTRSSIDECERVKKAFSLPIDFKFTEFFYQDPGFIESFANLLRSTMQTKNPQYVLFSYHGLPERHIRRLDASGEHCLERGKCCEEMVSHNQKCYRAQCYATTRAIAKSLNLHPDQYSVSFQSRLGRTPWIRPYTDIVYKELAQNGVKRLAVICPSFVSDCLETLEEIGMRGEQDFRTAGGEELYSVPCVNANPDWVRAVRQMLQV